MLLTIALLNAISHIVAGDHPEQIERAKQFAIDKENTIKGCGMCSLACFSRFFFCPHFVFVHLALPMAL
jgi:hypothetical protein